MNLIEDFKNFLASFTGLTSRLEATSAELKASVENINARDKEIADLKAKLESAPKSEDLKAAQDLAASEKARADKAEADLKAEQDAMPKKINDGIAQAVAANGHAPVATVSEPATEAQKPGAGLTGIARSIAIHKAQNSKK